MRNKTILSISFSLLWFVSCNPTDYKKHNNLEMRTYLDGKNAYESNCSACHGKKGEGFNNLYPALNNSSLYQNRSNEIPCTIFYGRKGNVVMPSFKNLNTETILAITNYLMEEYQSEGTKKFFDKNNLEETIKKCSNN